MCDLHKSKQSNDIDMLNDITWSLNDMFTTDNHEFDISNGTSVEQSKYFKQIKFFPWI